jgi:hypothetical protein
MAKSALRSMLLIVLAIGWAQHVKADDLIENFFGIPPSDQETILVGGEAFLRIPQSFTSALTENFPVSSVVPPFAFRRVEVEPGEYERVPIGPPGMGPVLFAERATTQGRGMLSTSASFTYLDYQELDGDGLGHLRFTGLTAPPGTTWTADLDLDVEATLTAAALAYGVTNNLDIAVVLPWVTVDFDNRTNLVVSNPAWQEPIAFSWRGHDSYEGLGDILIRSKLLVAETRVTDVALAFDYKTKTGDENKVLGTGYETYKPFVILSKGFLGFVPHLNVGYSFADAGRRSDELSRLEYAAGVEFVPTSRVTAAVSFTGFHKFHFDDDEDFGESIHNVSLGCKWVALQWGATEGMPPKGNLVVYANVMRRINDDGVRADWVPTMGMQVAF